MALRFETIPATSVSNVTMSSNKGMDAMRYRSKEMEVHPKRDESSSARVARFLHDKHPLKTAEMVSARTGIPLNTVKSWLRGAAKPSFDAMITMVAVYEAEFLASVMPRALGWLDEARIRAKTLDLEAQQARIKRELEALHR